MNIDLEAISREIHQLFDVEGSGAWWVALLYCCEGKSPHHLTSMDTVADLASLCEGCLQGLATKVGGAS